jgi:serine/threonine-protein kinase
MGVVYEAEHVRLKQRVAIKMLLPELMNVPDIVSRFEREARAAGQLRSSNVARVLDVDSTPEGVPYMVMEYLDGVDLSVELGRRGPMPIAQAIDYVLQTCNAMREAHRLGIVHRDLKPSNLFLANVDGRQIIKVLDFGISKVEGDREARVTGTQATVGTPLYMSPEQIRSAKHVDARSDIWSLGIILYELIAGKTPYEGSTTAAAVAICVDPVPSLRAIRPDVPPALEEIILRALAKEREARFQSVEELARALSSFGPPDAQAFVSQPMLPALAPSERDLLVSARTEASDASSGAKRPGAATESPWATHAGRAKKSSWKIVTIVAAALVSLVTAIAFIAHKPAPHVTDTANDPPRATVSTMAVPSAATSAPATPQVDQAPVPSATTAAAPTPKPTIKATVKGPPPPAASASAKPPPTHSVPTSIPTAAPTRL